MRSVFRSHELKSVSLQEARLWLEFMREYPPQHTGYYSHSHPPITKANTPATNTTNATTPLNFSLCSLPIVLNANPRPSNPYQLLLPKFLRQSFRLSLSLAQSRIPLPSFQPKSLPPLLLRPRRSRHQLPLRSNPSKIRQMTILTPPSRFVELSSHWNAPIVVSAHTGVSNAGDGFGGVGVV